MDKPPAYLLWFFPHIGKHAGKRDYLVGRFRDMDEDRVALEAKMLRELGKADYIALPKTEDFAEARFPSGGSVPYPRWFLVTPAGHYALRELAVAALGKVSWTVVAAFLGGIVGAALGNVGNPVP